MSNHDIRLRRQKFTGRGSERFRNYGAVLQRHEREKRLKMLLKVFSYLFIIFIFIVLIVIVVRIEKKAGKKATTNLHSAIQSAARTW
ncbi:MAG TPA: hypothetical protein VG737_11125 [Cyclobacteriaceae bacterium]|nr:hypothetical protein [Cyclobacteriaceae bacterium]